jgi:hypothetical protein
MLWTNTMMRGAEAGDADGDNYKKRCTIKKSGLTFNVLCDTIVSIRYKYL